MRLLLFSDLHCDRNQAAVLVQMSREMDVVVGAGDFATCQRGLQPTIDSLSAIDRPTVLVPGNAESIEELRAACRGWVSARPLHGESVEIDGVTFFGIGGAIPPTPFGEWSWDHTEEAAVALLSKLPRGGVLVTHSPPRGFLDRDGGGRSLGSTAVRDGMDRTSPRLVVCGHIHASGGRSETAGGTTIINAGPAGMVWDLD
jgi:Icc-related predicted phosphoesterase